MITTLTPNPCIDKTLAVDKFDLYKMNRVSVLRTDLGGKGINVSTALHSLGIETCCTALLFEEDAVLMERALALRGFAHAFVSVPGKCRTCYKLFDRSLKHTIEINEYGPEIPQDAGEKLIRLLSDNAEKSSCVTLSGSLPKGLDDDFYFRCIKAVKAAAPKCRIAVDAEKKLLLKALDAGPSFLKPNIHEFQETFGCEIHSIEDLDREARKIVAKYGLDLICVSLGAEGAFITNGKESWQCGVPKVTVRSIQGAGDSVIAGMCMAMEQHLPLPEILHYGVSAASDSISKEGTQLCTAEGMKSYLAQDIGLHKI